MSTMTAIPSTTRPPRAASVRRMSSVMLVDHIEPCLSFWVDRLGFEVRIRIQGAHQLDFVTLGKGDVEILYRTRESLGQEQPGLIDGVEPHQPWVVMYLEVDDLDALLPSLEGLEMKVPETTSPFGTREVFVREPSGRIVGFSARS